jgi:uncharacterized protein DUF6983
MTILVAPTANNAFYQIQSTLEGVTFNFSFQFNQRCCCWYMSIADANGVDIYNGVKLICYQALLRKCVDPRAPAGDFLVISATTDDSPPMLNDLLPGTGRCSLLYITSDWLGLMTSTPPGLFQVTNGSSSVPSTESLVGLVQQGDVLAFDGGSPNNPYTVASVTPSGISLTGGYVAPPNGGQGNQAAVWTSPNLAALVGRISAQVATNTTAGQASTYGQAGA